MKPFIDVVRERLLRLTPAEQARLNKDGRQLLELFRAVQIANDPTSPHIEFVVCATENSSLFTDNVEAECAWCEVPIYHRPDAPPATKICMQCAVDAADAAE